MPHGWGMTVSRPLRVTHSAAQLQVNGTRFDLAAGISLLEHPDVCPRLFEGGTHGFSRAIRAHTPGDIISELHQIASYSRHGFLRHEAAALDLNDPQLATER